MGSLGNNIKMGGALLIVSFALSAALLFGGAKLVEEGGATAVTVAAEAGGGEAGGPVSLKLVAKNIQFDKSTLNAAPGAQVTITLDNQDAGQQHNVGFYRTNKFTESDKIFALDILKGPASGTGTFTAPSKAGNYFFRCDVHPDQMKGTLIVK
jgi:plastocyanin